MAPIKFGIVQLPYQLSDVTGPVDILSTSSQAFLQTWQQVDNVPQEIVDKAPDYEFYYIGEKLEEPQTHTGNMKVLPNTTFDTCPKLDYLLVGGPAPDFFMNVPESYAKFLRERVDEVKTVFTTCTGACVVANVGLLDGLKATANHQVIPMMKQVNPKVQWTDEKQWIVDGKCESMSFEPENC